MDISPIEFSKFMKVAFNEYYSSTEDWKILSNDFTQRVFDLVSEFNAYQGRVITQIDNSEIYSNSEVAQREFEMSKVLKKEWQVFVQKFSELESMFENKYGAVLNCFDDFMQVDSNRKTFLSEYSAYSYLESMYRPLASFEEYLDEYRDLCLKTKSQGQPNSGN